MVERRDRDVAKHTEQDQEHEKDPEVSHGFPAGKAGRKPADASMNLLAAKPEPDRQRDHQHEVETEGAGDIAVQQGMGGALSAASGAMQAGRGMQPATWKQTELRGIEEMEDGHESDRGERHSGQGQHAPGRNRTRVVWLGFNWCRGLHGVFGETSQNRTVSEHADSSIALVPP